MSRAGGERRGGGRRAALTPASLLRIARAALGELDLNARVYEALPPAPSPLPARIVAVGKAGASMAEGALRRWGPAVERCLVVLPDATDDQALVATARRLGLHARVTIVRAAHPVPDARSVRAARLAFDIVNPRASSVGGHGGDRDGSTKGETLRTVLVLVSGGASSLLCAPAEGVTRREKVAISRALLASGAPIQDINVVRKHLSRIKGGGLLRVAAPNPVVSLVASDVVGGGPSDVGSGPSVPDESTVSDARRVLRRYAPAFAAVPLVRTRTSRRARDAAARILASPEDLARIVSRALRDVGIVSRVLRPSQVSVEEMADAYVTRARQMAPGTAFVRAAEPSVEVGARAGRGGRSTHLAALVGRDLPRGVVFLALATDGVDGGSGTSGALVDGSFASRVARTLGADALARSIARFDTGPLHRRMGTAMPAMPSGQNLADLHILLRV